MVAAGPSSSGGQVSPRRMDLSAGIKKATRKVSQTRGGLVPKLGNSFRSNRGDGGSILKKSGRNGSLDSPYRDGRVNLSTRSQHSQLGNLELPQKKEVFNGFKERMRENLIME